MEQIIEIIENRIKDLKSELEIKYMGQEFYENLEARIDELEGILTEIQMTL
jgi:hypothetical protein